jgi:hypothetical protein
LWPRYWLSCPACSDAAGNHEIGFGADVCRYGSTFLANVLAGAALAAIWGAFVSVR